MTKHNLKDHLDWLLRNGVPSGPPLEYASVPVSDSVDSTSIVVADQGVAPPFGESLRPASQAHNGLQNPAVPAMARLQIAPQPVSRNRLLTQTNPTPAPTNQPLPNLPHPISKHEQHEAPQPHDLSVNRTPAAGIFQRSLKTPATGYEDTVFDDASEVFDIDDLDLTCDHDTSFEEFGDPTRLWREDSATQKEPITKKRGKKRKSDEYTPDLGGTGAAGRGKHYAHDLNRLQDTSVTPSRKSGRDSAPAPLGGSKDRPHIIRYDEELSITETTIRTETRRSRSSAQVPPIQLSQSSNTSSHLEDQDKLLPPPKDQIDATVSSRRGNVVVPDSEDDDEEAADKVKRENTTHPLPRTDHVCDNEDEEALISKFSAKAKHTPCVSHVKHEPLPSISRRKAAVNISATCREGLDVQGVAGPLAPFSPISKPSCDPPPRTTVTSGGTVAPITNLSKEETELV